MILTQCLENDRQRKPSKYRFGTSWRRHGNRISFLAGGSLTFYIVENRVIPLVRTLVVDFHLPLASALSIFNKCTEKSNGRQEF